MELTWYGSVMQVLARLSSAGVRITSFAGAVTTRGNLLITKNIQENSQNIRTTQCKTTLQYKAIDMAVRLSAQETGILNQPQMENPLDRQSPQRCGDFHTSSVNGQILADMTLTFIWRNTEGNLPLEAGSPSSTVDIGCVRVGWTTGWGRGIPGGLSNASRDSRGSRRRLP